MARRTRAKDEDVEAYKHETVTRKNVAPVGLTSYDTSTPKPKKYAYDPHLDNIKQQFLTANNQEMNLPITLSAPANRSRVVRAQCKRLMTIICHVLPVILSPKTVIHVSPKSPMLRSILQFKPAGRKSPTQSLLIWNVWNFVSDI